MAVFRIDKTRDYTVMANHHLRNKALSLKAKGLLSLMLSLPEDWDYTTKGLSMICKDGVDSIPVAELHEETGELEQEKGKDGRRYKLLTVIIIFGFLLVLLAVSAQSYRGINQDKSEALTFNEMESEIIDTTEETTEVSLVGID